MKLILVLLAASLVTSQGAAQSMSVTMERAFLEEQCKPELRQMLAKLAVALPSVPIIGREDQICSCAFNRLFEDKALRMIFDADNQPLDPRLKPGDAKLQAFFFLKTTAAMHGCYASDFDAMASSLDPLK